MVIHTLPFTHPRLRPLPRFALEPLLPKKVHCKSQDKLDREELERERKDKEKKKEKRNSKHQEIFDKELKATDISMQPSETVILSEMVRHTHICTHTISHSSKCKCRNGHKCILSIHIHT